MAIKIKKGVVVVIIGVLILILGISALLYEWHITYLREKYPWVPLYFNEQIINVSSENDAVERINTSTYYRKEFALKNVKKGDKICVYLTLAKLFPKWPIHEGKVAGPIDYDGKKVTLKLSDRNSHPSISIMLLHYNSPTKETFFVEQNGNLLLSINSKDGISRFISPIKIEVLRNGKTIFKYSEEITKYSYLLPYQFFPYGCWILLIGGILIAIIGYTIIIKGLYIVGGIYNPVNPKRNRPPEG